jgi:phenylacetate-coenzyme A ligase PaaK-like adenylate-forming protein
MDRAFTWWNLNGNKTHATFMSNYDERFSAGDHIRYEWRYGFPRGARHILELMVDIDKQIDWLKTIRPNYLSVRGGAHLTQLALHAKTRNEQLRFDLILSGACSMTAEARELARDIFDAKVFDIYGTAEAGIVAYECPDCGLYHTCDETIFVEILREDGGACKEGEMGRVVLTPLYNYAMSLIRYEIGDYAIRGPEHAPCGRGLSSLSSIVGRYRNVFVLRDGRVIQPYVYRSLREHLSYRQLQLVQIDFDRVEIRYVPWENTTPNLVAITNLIHKLLDASVNITLVVCTENLNASVMMVESTQDRAGSDGADALNWTPERRVFVQRAVGSDFVVVAAITSQDSAQVRLPYDNDVVKTFAAD